MLAPFSLALLGSGWVLSSSHALESVIRHPNTQQGWPWHPLAGKSRFSECRRQDLEPMDAECLNPHGLSIGS